VIIQKATFEDASVNLYPLMKIIYIPKKSVPYTIPKCIILCLKVYSIGSI